MSGIRTGKPSKLGTHQRVLFVFLLLIVALGSYVAFSLARGNFREVVPRKVYRSGQPSPAQLQQWARRHGIKTVINLRGDEEQIIADERAMAKELGLNMISICLSARRLPARYLLVELIETLETVELPVLIHCRSGVDRAGTASALAAMAIGGVHYDKAKWQAYVAPGPWKRKKYVNRNYFQDYYHISDVFRLYESYCRDNGLQTNNWQQLKQWVADTEALPETEPE